MKAISALALLALLMTGCAGATYRIDPGSWGLRGECLFSGETVVASMSFYNGRWDTVSVLMEPVAGVRATDLEVLPPGSWGTVAASVRCQFNRQFSTEVVVAPLRAGLTAAAKKPWAFNDNFRNVRRQSIIVGGSELAITLR